MSLPLATTTITVTRVAADPTRDGYDTPPAPTVVAAGIRAVIAGTSSRSTIIVGNRVVNVRRLHTDPCDLQPGDTVTDDSTGQTFRVMDAGSRYELGVGYSAATLQTVEGAG